MYDYDDQVFFLISVHPDIISSGIKLYWMAADSRCDNNFDFQ